MQETDKVNNYYRFEHVNGDFRVVTEFNAEQADELFPHIIYFLRGCSWPNGIIEEHLSDTD
jgi:hypothetical protein